MLIAIPAETQANERRVAATPETVKKMVAAGFDVQVQEGAGQGSMIDDAEYEAAGASIRADLASTCAEADLVLKVQAPDADELVAMKRGAVVVAMFAPHANPWLDRYLSQGLTCMALELIPRISRAQSMDVLSSQANIAGYKAVLLAAEHYPRYFPMLMTAAGTVQPARVLVLGAGVAGLQAIATARRLGAVVEAFDVRAATREQVESLGARFIQLEGVDAEDERGYARELTDEEKAQLDVLVAERTAAADIVITTAQIPGRRAPELVKPETVERMRKGSVIVDLAAASGGNCRLTQPDQVIVHHGVALVGITNVPSLMAADASLLFARNVWNFVQLLVHDQGTIDSHVDDEIVTASMLCREGEWLKPEYRQGGES
ncbi:MAG: Re/Si-specific NAD(P)(+) transhydrogenase subunit alpha [Zetaproteobacteria bacterium]|nr:MAG: Re/Si-specific NAD(P)(+) transhydrogenase subunit alpha [Zetaproteobacteria bacterium]